MAGGRGGRRLAPRATPAADMGWRERRRRGGAWSSFGRAVWGAVAGSVGSSKRGAGMADGGGGGGDVFHGGIEDRFVEHEEAVFDARVVSRDAAGVGWAGGTLLDILPDKGGGARRDIVSGDGWESNTCKHSNGECSKVSPVKQKCWHKLDDGRGGSGSKA